MLNFIKKCVRLAKLFLIYWRRIIFAKNHFKCPWYKKLRANLSGGFLADQWMLYDFDHNDKGEYLSEFDWYRSRYINEPFDYVLNNKIVASEVLQQYVRVPKNFVICSRGHVTSFDSKPISTDEILELIRREKLVFIKPYAAGKGTGVNSLGYDGESYLIDREKCTAEQIVKHLKGRDNWYISESMHQHEYLNKIYDQTVNTIRMITLRDIHTNAFKIFFAVQRIGTFATIPVDNGSRGGLVANIDLATGTLSEARCLHNRNVYKVHPDSGAPIEGVVIPNWDAIKEEMLALANKMPYMHFIAWDILITESGEVCIIEGNTSSGVNIIQLWGGQRHGELGDFYRHHGIKV